MLLGEEPLRVWLWKSLLNWLISILLTYVNMWSSLARQISWACASAVVSGGSFWLNWLIRSDFYFLGILSFYFVNSCQFVILIVSSLFVIRMRIFLYGICAMCFIFITLQYLPNQWIALLARFDWLPQLGRFLAIHCSPTGAKMASRFEAFSEDEIWPINEAVFTNKYQESDYLWLVGVYW